MGDLQGGIHNVARWYASVVGGGHRTEVQFTLHLSGSATGLDICWQALNRLMKYFYNTYAATQTHWACF